MFFSAKGTSPLAVDLNSDTRVLLPRLRRTLGRLPIVPEDVADDPRAVRLVDDQAVYTVARGTIVAHLKAAKLRVRSGRSIAPVVFIICKVTNLSPLTK